MTGKPAIVVDLAPALEAVLFDESLRDRLRTLGTVGHTGGSDERMRSRADILITGWGTSPLPAHRTDTGPLRFIAHSAGTVRELVPKSLLGDGIRLSHAAAGMARSVAEMALYFTLGQLRSLHATDRAMHQEHDWRQAASSGLGRTVAGTRVGVIGASRVGRVYIELVRALGATVAVFDPYLPAEEADQLGVIPTPLETLLRSCPVIALHAPVTTETRGMLSADRLAMIPTGGILVNTARSALLDSAALAGELRSGRLSAALDVFDDEPLPRDSPLWGLPNVVLTPHIGAVTSHSRHLQGSIVVEEIERYVRGLPLVHEIRAATYDRLA